MCFSQKKMKALEGLGSAEAAVFLGRGCYFKTSALPKECYWLQDGDA